MKVGQNEPLRRDGTTNINTESTESTEYTETDEEEKKLNGTESLGRYGRGATAWIFTMPCVRPSAEAVTVISPVLAVART